MMHQKPRGASQLRDQLDQPNLAPDGLSIEASLTSPPVDGAANAELLILLAGVLGVSKSSLRLVQGETAKNKVVEVTNTDAAEGDETAGDVVR
jgi:uncharacterized protein